MNPLTHREIETLTLLAAGERSADIAKTMGVTPVTMRRFKQSAAQKLGLVKPSDIALVNAARPQLTAEPPPVRPDPVEQAVEPLPEPLDEIAAEYPGKLERAEWLKAEPNIRARLADGEKPQRLRTAAIMYRRQHAAYSRREVEILIAQGEEDEEVARRKAKPVPIVPPEKFFDFDGPWRGRFPPPPFLEIPPEPVPGDGM